MIYPADAGKICHVETFEKRSISFKIKARDDFNHPGEIGSPFHRASTNILNILRIKIRTQRRDRAKGGVVQRSHVCLVKVPSYVFSLRLKPRALCLKALFSYIEQSQKNVFFSCF